jgi:succinoglycan biosynthesis transport protein ExoP
MDQETKIRLYETPPHGLEKRRTQGVAWNEAGEIHEVPNLLEYWRVIQKRYATILTILFLVFTFALVATLKEKPVYKARALIEIQKENPELPTLQELFQVENISDTYLETQYRILKSENLGRRVIAQLRLDQVAEIASAARARPGTRQEEVTGRQVFAVQKAAPRNPDADSDVLKNFQGRLNVEPMRRSRLVEVSFESNDPNLAAEVVNTLAAVYAQQNLEARWEASQKATQWLSQQLLDMKAQLEKSENELQQYARENGLLFLETGKGTTENVVAQRLWDLREELTKVQARRYEKESLYRLVQHGDFASLPGVSESKLMEGLAEKLAELKRERSRLTTTFNADYPRVKEIQSQIDESEAALVTERERTARLISNDYRAAVEREEMIQAAFEEQQAEVNLIAGKSVQYSILKREADTNKQLYVGLLEKLKETGVSTTLKATNIRVVDPAYPPKKPERPRLMLNLWLAFVLGLSLGIGAAFLQEHLDNTFKTAEDVERFLKLPALASVPAVESLNNHRSVHGLYERARLLASHEDRENFTPQWNRIEGNGQNTALAEAFHGLRTSVLFSTPKYPPKSLLVTSARVCEGKTTVAANLAVSLAQLNEPVLLIDADLRRPSLGKFFGVMNASGLVNFLTGNPDWRSLVHHAAPMGLDVLFCGPVPPNPADLLSSEYMRTLIREASKEYKFVVLDSPPLLDLADSRVLATLVDGVILVIGGGITPRDLVHRAYLAAVDAGSHVLGVTINFAETHAGYYSSAYQQEKVKRR